jgi:hypothetical protein
MVNNSVSSATSIVRKSNIEIHFILEYTLFIIYFFASLLYHCSLHRVFKLKVDR